WPPVWRKPPGRVKTPGERAGRPVGDVWAVSFGSPRGRGAWHAHLPRCRRLPMLRIGALLRLAAARTKPRSPAPVKAPSIRVGVIRKTRPRLLGDRPG